MKIAQIKEQYSSPESEELRLESEGIMEVSPTYNSPFTDKEDW